MSDPIETQQSIDLSFVVPGSNENRWSDLIATFAATDPEPLAGLLGVSFDDVKREVSVTGATKRVDRLDLLLRDDGRDVAVIEAKLLSDLGRDQLVRYESAFRGAETYRVLHLARLPVNLHNIGPWKSLTWEDVIDAYTHSDHPWVATTAKAWQEQLSGLVPQVGPETVWNDVPDDPAGFELAMRARIAWLASRLHQWCELEHDMEASSGGGNWVIRLWAEVAVPHHVVTLELQEGLTAYEWKVQADRPYRDRLPGPVGLLGLRHDSDTSATFDWTYLHSLFKQSVLDADGAFPSDRQWQRTLAQPRHPVDKENWLAMVEAGAPKSLGKGWGMRVAETYGECVFGARYGLPPASTLAEVETDLKGMVTLIESMSSEVSHG